MILSDINLKLKLHITGIYSCTLLDHCLRFCENFKQSRNGADRRFYNYIFRPHSDP